MDNENDFIRIGIFGYESKDYGDIVGKCEFSLINFTKFAVQYKNIEIFYFCASRVNMAEHTITGTFYDIDNNNFYEKIVPFPDSIYKEPVRVGDLIIRLPNSICNVPVRHRDRYSQSDKVVHRYIQKIIPSTHVIMGDKFNISNIMEMFCPKYNIQTYIWDEETIDELLEKHKVLILKSATSSGGRNIFKLSKDTTNQYSLRIMNTLMKYDKKLLFTTYSKQFKSENYMVQPFIESMTNDGHPFVLRINVFRNGEDKTLYKEIGIRKGEKGTPVANAAMGSEVILDWEDFLRSEFGTEQFKLIYDEIEYVANHLIFDVQKGYPNIILSGAGFDCGLNRANNNELKIFEINRTPHLRPMWSIQEGKPILNNMKRLYPMHEARFNFCLYLAKNSQNIKKQQILTAVEAGKYNHEKARKTLSKSGYVPTKKAIAITFDRSDSIDCTFNELPISEKIELTWEVTDTSIARICKENVISAVSKGETTVNAIVDNEIVASVPIYVERQPLPSLSKIQPSRFTFNAEGMYLNNKNNSNKATLMFVGDLMFLSEQQRNARTPDGSYNFNPSFEYIKPLLAQSDFSMGTLETIVDPTYPYKWEQTKVDDGTGYMVPNCNAPVTCLDAIRYGNIDAVSTANNHCLDSGIRGLLSTIDHLDKYKIMRTGTFKETDQRYLLINVNGIIITILAYTTYLNLMENLWNLTPQEKNVHTNHYIPGITEKIIKTDIEKTRKLGADFVIVMLHAGLVNTLEPVGKVVEVCRELANAGADYILNTHSHTLQSHKILTTKDGRNVPIIYSMGNFISSMDQVEEQRNRDAIILTIELEKKEGKIFMNDGYVPCFSRRNFKGNKFVTLPCDKAYNNNNQNDDMIKAKKRIKQTLGKSINKISSKKYDLKK